MNDKLNKLKKIFSSLKLTVICLVILVGLVVFGTVYQVEHGLYQAQQKFFHSWFFLIFGFIPFPGTIFVMFVLFFNLIFLLIFRIGFRLKNIGNTITHLGIVILLAGGLFTMYFSQESWLRLFEGETSSMSSSSTEWEFAAWEDAADEVTVYGKETKNLKEGKSFSLADLNLNIGIIEFYDNCSAYYGASSGRPDVLNSSGITLLKQQTPSKEKSDDFPGMVFVLENGSRGEIRVLLYSNDLNPTGVFINNTKYFFSLRRKKLPLPFSIKLIDFKMKHYPNSSIVKSYESMLQLTSSEGLEREVLISMNKPLRSQNLTMYQSSYFIAKDGSEYSILAVVENTGRLIPYISSLIIFLGMLIHFLMKLLLKRKK